MDNLDNPGYLPQNPEIALELELLRAFSDFRVKLGGHWLFMQFDQVKIDEILETLKKENNNKGFKLTS